MASTFCSSLPPFFFLSAFHVNICTELRVLDSYWGVKDLMMGGLGHHEEEDLNLQPLMHLLRFNTCVEVCESRNFPSAFEASNVV